MSIFAGAVVLGDADVVVFRHLRMWAERGLIHVEDGRTGEYKVNSVRTMLQKMRAIQELIVNSKPHLRQKGSHDQFDAEWVREHQGMVEAMVQVVQKAKVQGMPSDASARRDLVRRRPKTVVVPGYGGGL